ncbi:hypothetical protein KCMC57_up14140 [Kitasatospora sp. CMC57]|uniref:Transposase n=1 Tax=Kitasatospora sp. CMC57 TaxID=3231513 RepID=A0AB33JXH5_9ACTN
MPLGVVQAFIGHGPIVGRTQNDADLQTPPGGFGAHRPWTVWVIREVCSRPRHGGLRRKAVRTARSNARSWARQAAITCLRCLGRTAMHVTSGATAEQSNPEDATPGEHRGCGCGDLPKEPLLW